MKPTYVTIGTVTALIAAAIGALGTMSSQDADSVAITGGSIAGITDLAVADGGTGASNAAGARDNLDVVPGTDVQAFSARLSDVANATWNQGDTVYFNGTNLVDLAPGAKGKVLVSGGPGANPSWEYHTWWRRFELAEEMWGGQNTTGNIGEFNWQFTASGGTTAAIPGEAGHPGIRRLTTGATNGNSHQLFNSASNVGAWLASDIECFGWNFRLGSTAAEAVHVGMQTGVAAFSAATEAIWFSYDPGVSAKWQTNTRAAANTETVTTTVADVAASTWYYTEWCRTDGSGVWTPYLNGSALTAHTVRLPAANSMIPVLLLATNENVAKSIDVDYFVLRTKEYTTRW